MCKLRADDKDNVKQWIQKICNISLLSALFIDYGDEL